MSTRKLFLLSLLLGLAAEMAIGPALMQQIYAVETLDR
jgi:hypothetical protein